MPLALQGCYLLALRFSAYLGVGHVTSFSYAYLAASTLVGATAFSLGLISSAPLTRRGIDGVAAGRHVVHAAWISCVIVGAAAGVFGLVGGRIVGAILGSAYSGEVGRELGHLVVYLAFHRNGVRHGEWSLALWPDRPVSLATVHSTASDARRALGRARPGPG